MLVFVPHRLIVSDALYSMWLVQVGDPVIPGNAVAEIVTDKASMSFEAQDDGFIAALLVDEGVEVRALMQ